MTTVAKATSSWTPDQVGRKYGFRSGLEEQIAAELEEAGVDAEYESKVLTFVQPARERKYTPDFILPNGVILETKGRFVTADRQKHLMIKASNPGLDIRFIFSNPNARIGKKSKTTYAMWCANNGFKYVKAATKAQLRAGKSSIPEDWLS